MINNKIRNIVVVILTITLFFTSGCIKTPEYIEEIKVEEPIQERVVEEPMITVSEETDDNREYITISSSELSKTDHEQNNDSTGFYVYHTLNEDEKKIYAEILTILTTFGENVLVSTIDTAMIDKAYQCVMLDHPEIFYVKGYSITKITLAGVLKKITVSGAYTMTPEEKNVKEKLIELKVQEYLSGISADASDYEKMKYIYEYLIEHTEYDADSEDNQNICSVLLNQRSVCQGYAKTTQLLALRLGIDCMPAEGVVRDGQLHVWNVVRLDGNYYHVDTTWGDASYTMSEEQQISGFESTGINYDYLCISDEMVERTHEIQSVYQLPVCNSMTDNYFVREHIYFEQFDEMRLKELFEQAYQNNQETVQLKCADGAIYKEYYDYLIDQQKIFEYLQGTTSVRYAEMKDQYSIIFYL